MNDDKLIRLDMGTLDNNAHSDWYALLSLQAIL